MEVKSKITIESFKKEYESIKSQYDHAQETLAKTGKTLNDLYVDCIKRLQPIIKYLDNMNPNKMRSYDIVDDVKQCYLMSGDLLIRTINLNTAKPVLNDIEKNTVYVVITHMRRVIDIEPFNEQACSLLRTLFMFLTLGNGNTKENVILLEQALSIAPYDYQLQYNLGFCYHRDNNLDKAIIHFKLAKGIIDNMTSLLECQKKFLSGDKEAIERKITVLKEFNVKTLTGIGSIYYSAQQRDLALYFFTLAEKIDATSPEVLNQIAVIYTEMRDIDKSIEYYERGITQAKKNPNNDTLSMLYMNRGLALCYECDFEGAIASYNQSLKYKPTLSLAYQNKLLDVNYISYRIADPMYITRLHKSLNKIYPKVITDYRESCPDYKINTIAVEGSSKEILKKRKLRIGFVSGDYICHPVSYFISSVLKGINKDLFEIFCYSVKITHLDSLYPDCFFKIVKNLSPEEFKELIQKDSIDILFDLSAHTGDNRLDTFVLKPAPIQISYCGYPNTSGIKSMDYHITDTFCDSDFTQKYYVEKLLFMNKCFLCYNPYTSVEKLVDIVKKSEQPFMKNGYITFGCFNRYNKVNNTVAKHWNNLLKEIPTARFVIKTKEFLTEKLKKQFLENFEEDCVKRVIVLRYSDSYDEHLDDYNKIDIALDTFPYSGTTTSCEALVMGVPIITLYDDVRKYHVQNVTSSLLINSELGEYVTHSKEAYINKAKDLSKTLLKTKEYLKEHVRHSFIDGAVCDRDSFCNEFEDLLFNTYKTHFNTIA